MPAFGVWTFCLELIGVFACHATEWRQDNSPRREPWVSRPHGDKHRRGDRVVNGGSGSVFSRPIRGFGNARTDPTAHAVGYYPSPLRG